MFLFRSTPVRERAAFTFAGDVLSKGFQTEWALGMGYLPINLKSREALQYKAFVQKQPSLKIFLDQMKSAQSRPLFPGYTRVSDSLGRALEAVLLSDVDPAIVLTQVQSRLDLIFATP